MTSLGPLMLLIASTLAQSGPEVAARPSLDFRLQDHRGAWHSLDEVRSSKVVVIAFVGTECPLAEAYAPRLVDLAKAFETRGVAFFGVDANPQDGPVAIGRFVDAHAIPFPILKDVEQELTTRLGAERTPEVFVLDEARNVRYQGRIDDQYALGIHRPSPSKRDLLDALEALLAGKDVSSTRTDAAGCKIARASKGDSKGGVTYSKQVSRILQDRCVACHRPGEIAPFSLTDYRQAAGWSSMIAEVVDDGRMPPWHASAEHGKFANDARLTAVEKKAIAEWVSAGSPEGDLRELPPPVQYAEGWRIPKPDLVLEMPEEVEVPATGWMPYKNYTVDPKLTKDVWVRASQVRPGNASVVHHMVVYVLPPGVTKLNEARRRLPGRLRPGHAAAEPA